MSKRDRQSNCIVGGEHVHWAKHHARLPTSTQPTATTLKQLPLGIAEGADGSAELLQDVCHPTQTMISEWRCHPQTNLPVSSSYSTVPLLQISCAGATAVLLATFCPALSGNKSHNTSGNCNTVGAASGAIFSGVPAKLKAVRAAAAAAAAGGGGGCDCCCCHAAPAARCAEREAGQGVPIPPPAAATPTDVRSRCCCAGCCCCCWSFSTP